MTLRNFNALSEPAKSEVVELWGDLITEKTVPGYRVKVYQIKDFYVEAYFDSAQDQLKRYRACLNKDSVCTS